MLQRVGSQPLQRTATKHSRGTNRFFCLRIPTMPTAPRASFGAEQDAEPDVHTRRAHTTGDATEHPGWVIYFDYNGVLNTGGTYMLEAMCRFLVRVDHLDNDIYTCLLSYSPGHPRRTLAELDDAGVLDLFDQITFTKMRRSGYPQGMNATEHRVYKSTHPAHANVTYEIFQGGKDEYIRSSHNPETDACIMFVDDKAQTLEAARELMPCLHATEMRRHTFFSDPRNYKHVHNLDELYNVIRSFAR